MARPSKFRPEAAARIRDVIGCGCGRELAARMAGVSLRTLVNWLAKGRAVGPTFAAFAAFAAQVDAAKRELHTARLAKTWLREAERRRERYREFRVRRVEWWRERLGEEAFWAARLRWLRDHGRDAAADRLEARPMAEGSDVKSTR